MAFMEQRMLPPEQAAKYLGVTVGWLAKRRVYGDGPAYTKLLGRILYDRIELDALIERNKRTSTSETPDLHAGA
jgi:hypothetical protein